MAFALVSSGYNLNNIVLLVIEGEDTYKPMHFMRAFCMRMTDYVWEASKINHTF